MKVTNFQECDLLLAPVGLNAAVTAAALQDHTSRSEFMRRAIIERFARGWRPARPQNPTEASR